MNKQRKIVYVRNVQFDDNLKRFDMVENIWIELKKFNNKEIEYNEPVTEEELKKFEIENNISIPQDLRSLLLIHNGINKSNGIINEPLWPSLNDLYNSMNEKSNDWYYKDIDQNMFLTYDIKYGTILECSIEPDLNYPWEVKFDSIKHWLQCVLQACKDNCNNLNYWNICNIYGIKAHQKSIYQNYEFPDKKIKKKRNKKYKRIASKRIKGYLNVKKRKNIEGYYLNWYSLGGCNGIKFI